METFEFPIAFLCVFVTYVLGKDYIWGTHVAYMLYDIQVG